MAREGDDADLLQSRFPTVLAYWLISLRNVKSPTSYIFWCWNSCNCHPPLSTSSSSSLPSAVDVEASHWPQNKILDSALAQTIHDAQLRQQGTAPLPSSLVSSQYLPTLLASISHFFSHFLLNTASHVSERRRILRIRHLQRPLLQAQFTS